MMNTTIAANLTDLTDLSKPAYAQLPQDISILLLYSFTTIIALYGNTIVCFVSFRRKMTTTTYILIGNMAISDILGALTIPGQWLFCWRYVLDEYGERGCGMMKSAQILSYYISTFTMTVISYDRYRIVYYPLSPRIKPFQPICAIWILGTVCVIPTMVSMRISEYFTPERLIYCRVVFKSSIQLFSTYPFRKFRVTFVLVTQFLIPLSIAITLYALSIRKIYSRNRIGAVTDQQFKDFDRSKWRTIKMLTIALMVFMMAWFPVQLIHMIDFYITPLLANNCNSSYYYLFFYWLAISSCSYNPFIYCWFNNEFRSVTKSTFFCRRCLTSNNNNNINRDQPFNATLSSSTTIFYTH